MKREKKFGKIGVLLTVAALVIGLAIAPAAAQAKGRGADHDPDRAASRMADRLDLTTEQEAQVKDILTDSYQERKKARAAHRQVMEDKLAKVLTDDQMEELKEMKEDRRDCRDDGVKRGRRGGKGHGRD